MSIDRSTLAQKWLATEGQARYEAVQEAACLLLHVYLQKWAYLIPVELHRLAATLNAEIVRLQNLDGDAILMPVQSGFRILVNAALPTGRFRASVAHELVHTLFYAIEDGCTSRRSVPHTPREEPFCFDVARHLLAPKEHLEAIGVLRESDPAVIFAKLTKVLLLSRPWAARVMLADHVLAKGIAGRWVRTDAGCRQEKYSATATPSLSRQERTKLRMAVAEHLQSPEMKSSELGILVVHEKSSDSVFVLATQT